MTSLMQRKARTGREAQAARAMSLVRALRLTAAKQADHLMSLALSALSVTRKMLRGQAVTDRLDEGALILLMDGPGHQVAAALLDGDLVAGLIQQQTMGRVMPPREGAPERKYTATDAALCAPFVEALLTRAALLPDEEEDRTLMQGYRFGVWAREPRQAQLALDAAGYELIEMTLDMAAGARSGKLSLILPEPVRIAAPAPQDGAEDTGTAMPAGPKLEQNILGLNAELTIALTRLKMPLQKMGALRPGDIVDLNLSSMAQALVIDANGRAITRGTLGQINGMRALQVEQQRSKQHTQPRRRASDRDALDLPDVTAPFPEPLVAEAEPETPHVPSMADVDIFGDLDDLPDMPDLDAAADAADAQMATWDMPEDGDEDATQEAG